MTDDRTEQADKPNGPGVLVVQPEDSTVADELIAAGHRVLHHTNNPNPWLEDVTNLLSVDLVIVAPECFTNDDLAGDVARLSAMFTTYIFMAHNFFLEVHPA